MKTKLNPISVLQAYALEHWDKKHDDLPDTTKYWQLVEDAKKDKTDASKFVADGLVSDSAQERILAASLAGQLCNPIEPEDEPMAREISELLVKTARTEKNLSVLSSIADELRFMNASEEIMNELMELTHHQDEDVRYFAARSLGNLADDEFASGAVITRLIELSSDKDSGIRDWTTFSLGQLIEIYGIDQPEIRDALMARIKDRHTDTRGEAFLALSMCDDKRAVEPLLKFLKTSKSISGYEIQAAGQYGLSEFYEPLLAIQKWWADKPVIDRAIDYCKPD